MALPYRGDEDFTARRGSYSPADDVEPVKRIDSPAKLGSFQSDEALKKKGCMGRVRRVQERFSQCCCSCIDRLPTPVFLLILLLLIALFVALTVFLISHLMSGDADKMEEKMDTDKDALMAFMILEISNETRASENNRRASPKEDFKFIGSVVSPDLTTCPGFGFACTFDPEKVVSTFRRCDGMADCGDKSDEKFCTRCNTAFSCPASSTNVTSPYLLCLRGEKICDGYEDCPDGSDEQFCHEEEKCDPLGFQCGDGGMCISDKLRCDGDKHCKNGEDEANCNGTCALGAVWCKTMGICVPTWRQCDGIRDCEDGEDEKKCTCSTCCGRNTILCRNSGVCIRRADVCDGKPDCPDDSDEMSCNSTCPTDVQNKVSQGMFCSSSRCARCLVPPQH